MKSKIARLILDKTPSLVKEEVERHTNNMIKLERIIDVAFSLYMPQIRSEITELAEFITQQLKQMLPISMGKDIEGLKPYNVLEIGTKFGGTFYIWNRIIQEHGAGLCISIDMSDGGLHGGISEEEMDKRDTWFHERFDDCYFIRGDSHSTDTVSKALDIFFPNWEIIGPIFDEYESIDFLFIDGDHSYDGAKMDFDKYSPFVKKGGCIAFHDIVISDRHHERNVYVGEVWNRITELKLPNDPDRCAYGGEVYAIRTFIEPGNDWAGIGLLIKQ